MGTSFEESKSAGSILIVDDVPSNLRDLSMILSRHGYEVRSAQDGVTALQFCAESLPDLILLDVRMPGMDGYEVCQRLKQDEATLNIPVIFLSAQSELGDIIRGFKAGGVDYISKPMQVLEVLARVQTHLALHNLQQRLSVQNARLQHEIAIRQQAEAALQQANDALEIRVAERTAELAQANASLRASMEIFRYLFEQTQDGYLILDTQDCVTHVNQQARLYLELQEEIPDQTFVEIVEKHYHREPQSTWATWRSLSDVDTASPGEIQLPLYLVRPETATSRAFWLQVDVLDVTGEEGEVSQRIVQLRDITEKTALQDELNKFHSMIMHKMRTPLVPLYSGLQFLVSNVLTLPKEDVVSFLDDAFEGITRLQSEIEDIIQYLDSPNVISSEAAFCLADLSAVVTEICEELSIATVQWRDMEQFQDVSVVLPRPSVELILREILENSKKFHPRSTPRVEIQLISLDEARVLIRISDDGVALSPEQLAHMWMPYYQGDKYATGQIAGMGLGLSLVATQVWSAGGTCRAFNCEGGAGLVVEIVLPTR